MKKITILLCVFIMASCSSGDVELGGIWGDDVDFGGGGGAVMLNFDYDPYVILSEICDLNLNKVDVHVHLSCSQFDNLINVSTPPGECDKITITDINGDTFTGLFRVAVGNSTKCE